MAFFSLVISQWKSRDPDPGQRLGSAVEQLVELRERRVELVHEDAAHDVDDGDLGTVISVVDQPEPRPGGLVGGN